MWMAANRIPDNETRPTSQAMFTPTQTTASGENGLKVEASIA